MTQAMTAILEKRLQLGLRNYPSLRLCPKSEPLFLDTCRCLSFTSHVLSRLYGQQEIRSSGSRHSELQQYFNKYGERRLPGAHYWERTTGVQSWLLIHGYV